MRGTLAVHICRGREWRGGERQVELLVRTLAWRSGYLQKVVTGAGSPLARALTPDGPSVLALPWGLAYDPRAFTSALLQLGPIARRHGRDVLLHAHDSHALAMALLVGGMLRLPVVATRRSVAPPGPLWRLPHRVIAISEAVGRVLFRAGVVPPRLVQVPSGIPVHELARLAESRPFPAAPAGPVILTLGALTPEKGHATLVQALPAIRRELPGARLQLAGGGSELARLRRLADDLGVRRGIEFLGPCPSALPLLAGAHLLAQPSLREALGTAVLEAMAAGIPVVASDTGGLHELLGDGAGLLVPPGDPEALAAAIVRVLTDALLRAALVHEARTRVADYDAPAVADRVAEVYRSALRTART